MLVCPGAPWSPALLQGKITCPLRLIPRRVSLSCLRPTSRARSGAIVTTCSSGAGRRFPISVAPSQSSPIRCSCWPSPIPPFRLAKSAAVAQVVTRAQLTTAIAQEELVEGTTSLAGPSLSGLFYTLGTMLPFIADAVSYAVSIVTLLLIRTPFQAERTARRRRFWAEIGVGVRWVWQQPFVLTMTLLMGAGAFTLSADSLIIIVLAQRQHASAVVIGLIIAAFGVGAILGSLLVPRLRHRLTVGQSILLTRWYFVLSWPLFALAPVPLVLGAVQFGSGVVEPIEDVPYFSHRLELIPDELRGRVLSACRMFPGLMRPLGLAVIGILIQRLGIFTAIWLEWVWLLVTTGIVTVIPQVRRERAGEPR